MFGVRKEGLYGAKGITGRILHVDGDKKYSTKAGIYYAKAGLNAIVKNIPEKTQPFVIQELIRKYKPDMLVITGHDRMLRKGEDLYNIYNYKNSLNFVKTVERARELVPSPDELVIFAGACQSFFEAIMESRSKLCLVPWQNFNRFYGPDNSSRKNSNNTRKSICNYL